MTDAGRRDGDAPLGLTPSQTVGPFLSIGLTWTDGDAVPEGTPGSFVLHGRVLDGAGSPVGDGMVETWQADPDGFFDHPDGHVDHAEGHVDHPDAVRPRGDGTAPGRGFGRCLTGPDGGWSVRTVRPGRLPAPGGGEEAPHLDVSVFARGLLDRVVTRVYFADEPDANAADPVLALVPPARRATLLAQPDGEGGWRFDVRLQGPDETVFFDV